MPIDRQRWFFSVLCLSVVFSGCHEVSPSAPGGSTWPYDTQYLGDGGWNGGGNGGTDKLDTASATGDTDTGKDTDGDTEDQLDFCPVGVGDRNLSVDDFWEIPMFTTGEESVFSDLFVAPGNRLYLFSDTQYCEIVLTGKAPNFEPESGSFCALSPEFTIRGWTLHNGVHFILDNKSRAVMSGFSGSGETVTYPLLKTVGDPTGLTSDGTDFWLSDRLNNKIWRIDTGNGNNEGQPSGDIAPLGIFRHRSLLYVLHGYDVLAETRAGEICYTLGLPVLLSGISIDTEGKFLYGVALDNNVLYRFPMETR